jgi:hypothetical protein
MSLHLSFSRIHLFFFRTPKENDELSFHCIIERHNAVMGRLCHEAKRYSTVSTWKEASEPTGYPQTRAVTGEILSEGWFMAIICARGDNSGASKASEGDVGLLISCLHYDWH